MSKGQKGSADNGTLMIVFGVCCALSVILIIFNWMGDSLKERRAHNGMQIDSNEENQKYEPFGYQVIYKRSLFGFNQE